MAISTGLCRLGVQAYTFLMNYIISSRHTFQGLQVLTCWKLYPLEAFQGLQVLTCRKLNPLEDSQRVFVIKIHYVFLYQRFTTCFCCGQGFEGEQVYYEGFSSTGGAGRPVWPLSPMAPMGRAGVWAGTPEAECQGWADRLGDERGRLARPRFSFH